MHSDTNFVNFSFIALYFFFAKILHKKVKIFLARVKTVHYFCSNTVTK